MPDPGTYVCQCGHLRGLHTIGTDGKCAAPACSCSIFRQGGTINLATPIHIRCVVVPPPELLRKGAKQEELAKLTTLGEVPEAVAEFLRAASAATLFENGGCVTLLVQKPRVRKQ